MNLIHDNLVSDYLCQRLVNRLWLPACLLGLVNEIEESQLESLLALEIVFRFIRGMCG